MSVPYCFGGSASRGTCRSAEPALRTEDFFHLRAHIGRALDDGDARLRQRVHLLRRRTLATRDDGARVTHASAWRRGLPCNETDDRLAELLLDEVGGFLLGGASDFANHNHRVGVLVAR